MSASKSEDGIIFFLSHLLPEHRYQFVNRDKPGMACLLTCERHEFNEPDRNRFIFCHVHKVKDFGVI